jgi:hypothetical protein
LLASAFYMFVKARKYNMCPSVDVALANSDSTVEYETVNLEVNDPKKTLGAKLEHKYDNKRQQKPEAENLDIIETPPRVDTGYGHGRNMSDMSGGSGDTFDRAPTLENGHPLRH